MMGTQASRQWGRRVLVVDDDPEVIQILGVNLAHANFDVISARNGAEALAMAAKERPDLILLDIVLPDLDGLDVCRQLKGSLQTRHIPVIAISAKTESEDRIASIAAGIEHYITKPFAPAEVVALVQASFKRLEQGENADPLTCLVNRAQINSRITAQIRQNKLFAVIYIDIDHFRVFNSVYGFDQGDRAIQLLADILYEAVKLFGNPDDLIGHCGGDDFIVVSTPQKARILCQTIIANFDSRVRAIYKPEDLERGYIEYQGRLGQREQCPMVSLSAAVVTNEKRTFSSPLQVSEIAAELRNYLRHFPGSNYYFDRRENSVVAQPPLVSKNVAPEQQRELKTTQGVLAWVTFLARELETPIVEIKDCLETLTTEQSVNSDTEEANGLAAIKESTGQILRILDELEHLKHSDWNANGTNMEGADLKSILDWVMKQVQGIAEQREVEVNVDGLEDIDGLMVDGTSLAQGLFYLIRNEVTSSTLGDQVRIGVTDANDGYITVEIANRHRYIPPAELATLFRGQIDSLVSRGRKNDLYLAKALLSGIGGKLKVRSRKEEGSIFTISIPKKWRSAAEQVGQLQAEAEAYFQTTRTQLDNLRQVTQSTADAVPAVVKESIATHSIKLQELEVLYNRCLFLADELSSQLERHQAQLLQQEVERYAASEALLVANRVIARLTQIRYIFDPECAKRVARNALAIADEFKISRSERQALHCAAMLKDLGLVSTPEQMLERKVAPTPERAASVSEFFDIVRAALSQLNFLAPALTIIMHQYERYDGAGHPSRLKGSQIPLGARILALADAFDVLTSGQDQQKILEPDLAVKELAADSGRRFDPEVVSAFLQAWRRKAIQIAPNKAISG
jgi:response regulator RpfG family c-di-GMP phosphodiesterase